MARWLSQAEILQDCKRYRMGLDGNDAAMIPNHAGKGRRILTSACPDIHDHISRFRLIVSQPVFRGIGRVDLRLVFP